MLYVCILDVKPKHYINRENRDKNKWLMLTVKLFQVISSRDTLK